MPNQAQEYRQCLTTVFLFTGYPQVKCYQLLLSQPLTTLQLPIILAMLQQALVRAVYLPLMLLKHLAMLTQHLHQQSKHITLLIMHFVQLTAPCCDDTQQYQFHLLNDLQIHLRKHVHHRQEARLKLQPRERLAIHRWSQLQSHDGNAQKPYQNTNKKYFQINTLIILIFNDTYKFCYVLIQDYKLVQLTNIFQ